MRFTENWLNYYCNFNLTFLQKITVKKKRI